MRKAFTSHAVFIVDGALRLKSAHVRRHAILICAFFCSGLTHVLVEWVDGGCALDLWGSLRLHLRCAGVVFLEIAIGNIYVGSLKRLGYNRNGKWIGRLEKLIGFLWTAGWLMELVPQYEWGNVLLSRGRGGWRCDCVMFCGRHCCVCHILIFDVM